LENHTQNGGADPAKKPEPEKAGPKLGELLVEEGFLKKEDIQKALDVQHEEALLIQRPLGEVLLKLKMISEKDLEKALKHPDLRQSLGSLALHKELVTRPQLDLCLKKQKADQFIGEVLIQEGILSPKTSRIF